MFVKYLNSDLWVIEKAGKSGIVHFWTNFLLIYQFLSQLTLGLWLIKLLGICRAWGTLTKDPEIEKKFEKIMDNFLPFEVRAKNLQKGKIIWTS